MWMLQFPIPIQGIVFQEFIVKIGNKLNYPIVIWLQQSTLDIVCKLLLLRDSELHVYFRLRPQDQRP